MAANLTTAAVEDNPITSSSSHIISSSNSNNSNNSNREMRLSRWSTSSYPDCFGSWTAAALLCERSMVDATIRWLLDGIGVGYGSGYVEAREGKDNMLLYLGRTLGSSEVARYTTKVEEQKEKKPLVPASRNF